MDVSLCRLTRNEYARQWTHKLAYTPTLTCFSVSRRKNRSGFHLSASAPQTFVNLNVSDT